MPRAPFSPKVQTSARGAVHALSYGATTTKKGHAISRSTQTTAASGGTKATIKAVTLTRHKKAELFEEKDRKVYQKSRSYEKKPRQSAHETERLSYIVSSLSGLRRKNERKDLWTYRSI